MAQVSGILGREWTGWARRMSADERLPAVALVGSHFADAMSHVVRRAGRDPRIGVFLSAAFMTWGIFYDKLELVFDED